MSLTRVDRKNPLKCGSFRLFVADRAFDRKLRKIRLISFLSLSHCASFRNVFHSLALFRFVGIAHTFTHTHTTRTTYEKYVVLAFSIRKRNAPEFRRAAHGYAVYIEMPEFHTRFVWTKATCACVCVCTDELVQIQDKMCTCFENGKYGEKMNERKPKSVGHTVKMWFSPNGHLLKSWLLFPICITNNNLQTEILVRPYLGTKIQISVLTSILYNMYAICV